MQSIKNTLALRTCLALMVLGASINVTQSLGVFDFRGWYIGFIISLLWLIKYFKLNTSIVLVALGVAIPSLSAYVGDLYSSPKVIFTIGFFLFLLMYAKAMVDALGYSSIMRIYAYMGLILAGSVIVNEIAFVVTPALSAEVFGQTESLGFLTRATGFLQEPSEAALYLLPPFIYFLQRKKYALLAFILLASLLTFSTLTYSSLAFGFLLIIYMDKRKPLKILLLPLFALGITFVASFSPQIMARVHDVLGLRLFAGVDFRDMDSSLATLVMNAMVAKDSIINSHFLGIGFGNFEYGFNEYAWLHFPPGYVDEEGLFWNRATGGSLLVRVTAELGVIGLVTIAYVLYGQIKAYAFVRGLPRQKMSYYTDVQAYVVTSIGMFSICLLRKDALANVSVFIFLAGALMLQIRPASSRGSMYRLFETDKLTRLRV